MRLLQNPKRLSTTLSQETTFACAIFHRCNSTDVEPKKDLQQDNEAFSIQLGRLRGIRSFGCLFLRSDTGLFSARIEQCQHRHYSLHLLLGKGGNWYWLDCQEHKSQQKQNYWFIMFVTLNLESYGPNLWNTFIYAVYCSALGNFDNN